MEELNERLARYQDELAAARERISSLEERISNMEERFELIALLAGAAKGRMNFLVSAAGNA